jgi:hypothetical protein
MGQPAARRSRAASVIDNGQSPADLVTEAAGRRPQRVQFALDSAVATAVVPTRRSRCGSQVRRCGVRCCRTIHGRARWRSVRMKCIRTNLRLHDCQASPQGSAHSTVWAAAPELRAAVQPQRRLSPATKGAAALYDRWLRRQPNDRVFGTSAAGRQSPSNIRRRVLAPAVKRANERLAEAGEVPLPDRLTPHRLRHTFASLLVSLGVDPGSVTDQLGHTDPASTLRVYRHGMRWDQASREAPRVLVGGADWAAVGSNGVRSDVAGRHESAFEAAGEPHLQGLSGARPADLTLRPFAPEAASRGAPLAANLPGPVRVTVYSPGRFVSVNPAAFGSSPRDSWTRFGRSPETTAGHALRTRLRPGHGLDDDSSAPRESCCPRSFPTQIHGRGA